MKNRRIALVAVIGLVVALTTSSPAVACWICKYSPNGWGFCRTGYLRGHGDCEEYVKDPFHGTTDCFIVDWGTCGQGYGGGNCAEGTQCEPYEQASMPCAWTDTDAIALV